ncbi:MAG: response regulator [Candidatus Marinamargulisbacteria bacterium]
MLTSVPTILIADNDPHICRIAKIMVPSHKYRIISAENGLDAYEKIWQHTPDLILSDTVMTQYDGFELHKKVKESRPNTPFIFLIGQNDPVSMARISSIPDTDHLPKPFTANQLINKIDEYLKPIISAENNAISVSSLASDTFQFGISSIDQQLYGHIYPQSFLMIQGPIGSGKSNITRQFILDGIKKNQPCLLVSFETPKEKLDPIFKLGTNDQRLFHFCDASRWTQIDSEPWRNIDFIFDYLSSECAQRPIQRIVIDSFSHGLAFWPLPDILKFVDLCRSLPNAEHQCILWTLNQHPSIETIIYHLAHVMDIGIRTQLEHGKFKTIIEFSKWQSYCNSPPSIEKQKEKNRN